MDNCRVLVLGSAKSGKTSLIHSLLKSGSASSSSLSKSDGIPEQDVPPQLPIVSVPGLYGGTLYVVDGSSDYTKEEDEHKAWLDKQIKRADAIVLCSKSDREIQDSQDDTKQWIARVRKAVSKSGRYVPIILAEISGSLKVDSLRGLDIETYIECSPHTQSNVSEDFSFWYAQKAILYPLRPLFNPATQTWQPKAERAITRVARLIVRADSVIASPHIATLQRSIFDGNFADPDEVPQIMDLATASVSSPEENLLHLMRIFIQKGRVETVWRILRYYGYSSTLEVEQDFLEPAIALEIRNDGSELIEFSDAGWGFLEGLWQTFSRAEEGGLSVGDLDRIFSVAPDVPEPFLSLSRSQKQAIMDLDNWLANWALLLVTDYKKTLAYLAYLGFPQEQPVAPAASIRQSRRSKPYNDASAALRLVQRYSSGKKTGQSPNRKIFSCFVLGETPAREGFLIAVGKEVIGFPEGGSYIVLQNISDPSQLSARKVASADLAIYVYRAPASTQSESLNNEGGVGLRALASLRAGCTQKLQESPSLVIGLASTDATHSEKSTAGEKTKALTSGHEATLCDNDRKLAEELDLPLPHISSDADSEAISELIRTSVLEASRTNEKSRSLLLASSGPAGASSWLVWSSLLAACCAGGYVVLNRGGLLQPIQQYFRPGR